jgi:hypothetical protein
MVISQIGFLVYYTGTAPPANSNVIVAPPLTYSADTSTLGISLPADVASDTGAANTYVASVPSTNFTPGLNVKLLVGHNSTSTTPTFAFNGSYAYTIKGPTGSALSYNDMVTTVPAFLLWTGSYWFLQNPQTSTPGIPYPGAGIPKSTGSAWGTSYGAQGTDGNVMTAGTVSGTGAALCTDANGGATTSGCGSGTIGGSGTTNYYALFTASTTLGSGHLDDGATLASWITSSEPFQVSASGLATVVTLAYNSGFAPSGTALAAAFAPDSSGNGDLSENGGTFYRICTTGNGQCSTGSTTNALTAAASGGAAPGSTFNGGTAVTFDYHSFGAAGLAASNTFTGATTNDFSGTSQFKLPVAAGYASLENGEVGYDSTNKNWNLWKNGADFVLVPLASGFTSGDCVEPTSSGGSWTIVDAGGACGISGGGVTSVSNSDGTLTISPTSGAAVASLALGHANTWSGQQTFVAPVLGAATATSLLASGIVDGEAPVTLTTGASCTLGTASGCNSVAYNSGYTYNQEATAATAVTYTLPTAAAGKQYCVGNSYNGSAATTGTLELLTSASGQFIIFTDGTLSATGGYVISGGAASDAACVVGVDSTHWQLYVSRGTWAKH